MTFTHFSHNGELRPIAEAVVPLSNIEYQYGFGVYETLRVEKGVVFFLDEHIARLIESARLISLEHSFDATLIAGAVAELVAKIGEGTYNLKFVLIGGHEPQLSIMPLNPHFPDKKLYRDGVHCTTYEYVRAYPHAKTLNMLRSYVAYREAKTAGAYDALFIDPSRHILEGTRTNFFCVRGKMLYSPPSERILLGVTRKIILKIAGEIGYSVKEKAIKLADLSSYEGAFLTSTSSGILPISSVDDHRFGQRPEALTSLMSAFDSFIKDCGGTLK